MSNEDKKVGTTLKYIENASILVFAVTECTSFFAFVSLDNISTGIMSAAIGLNVCAIIARIKNYKSVMKKKKKKHDEIVLLVKANLHYIKGVFSRSLIDSYIMHVDFLLVDNVLRKYGYIKEEINKL